MNSASFGAPRSQSLGRVGKNDTKDRTLIIKVTGPRYTFLKIILLKLQVTYNIRLVSGVQHRAHYTADFEVGENE